mmetsp:Transcript_104283/g.311438  ORF Transcript_104283/g.311438 Transcript_104283/m.311438 type:complete len:348 (-) Transcript_104283:3-1046(-)
MRTGSPRGKKLAGLSGGEALQRPVQPPDSYSGRLSALLPACVGHAGGSVVKGANPARGIRSSWLSSLLGVAVSCSSKPSGWGAFFHAALSRRPMIRSPSESPSSGDVALGALATRGGGAWSGPTEHIRDSGFPLSAVPDEPRGSSWSPCSKSDLPPSEEVGRIDSSELSAFAESPASASLAATRPAARCAFRYSERRLLRLIMLWRRLLAKSSLSQRWQNVQLRPLEQPVGFQLWAHGRHCPWACPTEPTEGRLGGISSAAGPSQGAESSPGGGSTPSGAGSDGPSTDVKRPSSFPSRLAETSSCKGVVQPISRELKCKGRGGRMKSEGPSGRVGKSSAAGQISLAP